MAALLQPIASFHTLPNCGTACRNPGARVTKQQPLPQPSLRCCPPLVMRNAAAMSYRGRRVTDEAFRSQEGEPTAGFSGFKCFAPSRLWLSEASLRALAGVGSIPAGNLVGLDPQSKCFFAWLNCGAGMPVPPIWSFQKTYGETVTARARGTPDRSLRNPSTGRNPAAAVNDVTASSCPAPSSSTSTPCGARMRLASPAIAR